MSAINKMLFGEIHFTYFALLMLSVSGNAFGYDDHPRRIAALGPDGGPTSARSVWETAIAIGEQRVVSLFNVGWTTNGAIGSALYRPSDPNDPNSIWEWSESMIPLDDPNDPECAGPTGTVDPSVVFDPTNDDFLAGGIHSEAYLARLSANSPSYEC